MWVIEKEIKKGDYLYAKVKDHPNATKNGYVLYHRIIMENYLGRLLLPTDIVHHKDKNKFNNCIDNLELLTKSEHNALHGKERLNINHGITKYRKGCRCLVCRNAQRLKIKLYRNRKKERESTCVT